MATRGLSLVGFYDREQDALAHLRNVCVFPHLSEPALLQEWIAARSKIGAPIPRAGSPAIHELEAAEAAYVQELRAQPWAKSLLERPTYSTASFKLVEIEPLLAHQPFIALESADHGDPRLKSAALADLMPVCLPQRQPKPLEPPTIISHQQNSTIIKSRRWHVDALIPALLSIIEDGNERTIAGIDLRWTVPFVNVVRVFGRCFLRTGYHRVFTAARLGATHIPCLLRDLSSGAGTDSSSESLDWLMMPQPLFESANPPTLGHFLRGRAHEVMLRATSLVVHVVWSQHLMPDEYEGL